MSEVHHSERNKTEVLTDIQYEKRVVIWLFRIAVFFGIYTVLALLLTPAGVDSLTYALPGYVFMGLFLFLTTLHYLTGVWSPQREMRQKTR